MSLPKQCPDFLYSNLSSRQYSPLSWNEFYSQEFYVSRGINDSQSINHHVFLTPPTNSGPLFVTHHGAGSSGLSFAVLAREISKILPDAGFLSFDARAHGSTAVITKDGVSSKSNPEDESMNLELKTLSEDMAEVIRQTRTRMKWTAKSGPDLVLIGHSLGGAVVTDVAKNHDVGLKIVGFAVLDVVEGELTECLS